MNALTRVILIGGTSHVGKSTFAQTLANELGWQYLSTDGLSRHPGRPWRPDDSAVPAHVAQYFQTKPTEILLDEVLQHFRHNVWPIAEAIIQCRLANEYDASLVLEGSAILPDCVSQSGWDRVKPLWLVSSDDILKQRIMESSDYQTQPFKTQQAVDGFLHRSLAFNRMLIEALTDSGFDAINIDDFEHTEELKNILLSSLK
ncbi:MAG: hypothetical protein AAF512_19810 [Pseudomonadota bacterium]